MTSKKTLNTILAGAVAVSALGFGMTSAHAMSENEEKCYGVVKTGMNGCAAADKSHGCAGQATTDSHGAEWVALPKGTCEKLTGGSVEPLVGDANAMEGHEMETHTDKH